MAKIIYITGLSGSGKTTLAKQLHKHLPGSILLDGDELRTTVNNDLGFTEEDKKENIRRNNALISLLYSQGLTVICAFMASIPEDRDLLFIKHPETLKIQLSTPLEVCQARDPKGLYSSSPKNFSGYTAPYKGLVHPDLVLDTSTLTPEESTSKILSLLN